MNSIFSSFEIKKYAVSFLVSFVITLILLVVLSVIFSFLPPPPALLRGINNCCAFFSSSLAAFFSARHGKGRGFVTGIFSSVIYMAILMGIGGVVFKTTVSFPVLIRIFTLTSLCGAVGGILGINCK